MPRSHRHREQHRASRIGWLRAAVLGANDGIVSTASLVVGVAAAGSNQQAILLTGVAGLVGGAMSMAAGEYVSVHSQADSENADLSRERQELREEPEAELRELAGIYAKRGVEPALARKVAEQLTAHDALGAHARDELGIVPAQIARPIQAALASAGSFTVGAAVPLLAVLLTPLAHVRAHRGRDLADLSRQSRRHRGARRRRQHFQGRTSRHVLERTRHGGDGRSRRAVRREGDLAS